jgi:hypothetical protein
MDGDAPKWGITKSLLDRFRGEEVHDQVWAGSAVRYLDESERAGFRLTVRDGRLYDAGGRLFDTSGAATLHSADSRAIFVMDPGGGLYASTRHSLGKFHHSSFLSGGDVAGAGELKVSGGDLKLISNKSTHYCPGRDMTLQVAKELRSRGVPLDDVDIEIIVHTADRDVLR